MGLGYHTVVIRTGNTCIAVGKNDQGQCNVTDWINIKQIAYGDNHTVGLKKDGTCIAIGDNSSGQCDVTGWTDIIQVSCGNEFTVGLKKNGTCVAVGGNTYNQCDITGWTDIKQIACNEKNTIGLSRNNTVVAVGDNYFGQCNVQNWTDIIQVGCGLYHTVGLRKDGTVAFAGYKDYGMGYVTDWKDIVQIACGYEYTVGIKKDGTCIGTGIGYQNHKIDMTTWKDIIQISCGKQYTIGLKKDGTVVATGENTDGQCNVENFDKVIGLARNALIKVILYLLKRNNDCYTFKDNELILSPSQILNKVNFETNGFSNLGLLKNIDKEGVKLLTYTEDLSNITLEFKTKTPTSILDRYDNLKLLTYNEELSNMTMRFTVKQPFVLLDKYKDLTLLGYDESNPEKMDLNCTLKTPFKPIDKFDKTCEICSDYAEDELVIAVNGDRKERYRYKIEFNGKIIKETTSMSYDETSGSFTIPIDYIDSIKNVSRETKFKVIKLNEFGDIEENECTVIVNPQRIFSKRFNGTSSYITVPEFNKPLSELSVQVIKKASTETSFTVDESNSLIAISNGNLIIGKTSFVGDIYEVRMWLKDKKQSYNGQPLLGDEEGLFAYFRLNEYESNICMDSCKNKFMGKCTEITTSKEIPSNASSLYDAKIISKTGDTVKQKTGYTLEYQVEKPVEHEYNVFDLKLSNTGMVEIPINLSMFENIENMNFKETV